MEWTLPPRFVETVWDDGQRIDSQIISATDLQRFGRQLRLKKTGCRQPGIEFETPEGRHEQL